jgi:thiosulfate reductase cytochrome b subunit
MFLDLRKELTNMLTSILGARLSWHFANGWVFETAIVGLLNDEGYFKVI